jgi:hypothetical protein
MQKTGMRIITERSGEGPCRNLFKELKMLPLKPQNIFSLPLFVTNNNS